MDTKKHTNFTEDEVKEYLEIFKQLVRDNCYTISLNENRAENVNFMEDYKIDSNKEKEILLSLKYTDFCYAVDNTKPKFAHEKLYVFCKPYALDYWGELVDVDIYIKSNLTTTRKGKFLIVVSFHKRNKPISYLF